MASAVAPHLPEEVLELPLVVNELGLPVLAHVAEDAGVALAVALDARLLGPDVDVQADPDAEADGAVDEPVLASG